MHECWYICCLQEGLTSLILATQNRHLKVVEALLDAKADPDITENVRICELSRFSDGILYVTCPQTVGWSAVFFAAKSGHLNIVQRLLRKGAKVDIKDKVRDFSQ